MILSGVTAASLIWLVLAMRGFRRLPVLLTHDVLVMRTGRLKQFRVPLSDIAGLRDSWTAEELKSRHVGNLAMIAWPNILIDLKRAQGPRQVIAIAHKLDDPAAFRATLLQRLSCLEELGAADNGSSRPSGVRTVA